MPVVPMPANAIYAPFVHRKGKCNSGVLENINKREVSAVSSHLIESSVSTKYNISIAVEPLPSKPRGIESHNQNTTAFSQTRAPIFLYTENTNAARRPVVSSSRRAVKGTSVAAAEPAEAEKTTAKLKPTTTEQPPMQLSRTQSVRATSQTSSYEIPSAKSSTTEPAKSTRATSRNTLREEAGITAAVQSMRITSHITTRARTTRATAIGRNAPQSTRQGLQSARPPLPSTHGVATRSSNHNASDEAHKSLSIDPSTILARTEELRNNIITALNSGCKSSSAFGDSRPITDHLPFVCKWVDYSKKHGIGYVLAEGSVGIVANHTDDMPITHTVVEHGYKYLKTTNGGSGSTVKAVPYTFFIQADDGSLEEVIMTGALRQQLTILWARFARYMCKQLNNQTPGPSLEEKERPMTIVRFYQRVGNVSAWGFSNGCFQVRLSPPSPFPYFNPPQFQCILMCRPLT